MMTAPTELFLSIICTLSLSFVIIMTFLLYLHRLLSTYSKIIGEVFEWNKQFGKPITFSYSWLKGVVIGVQENKDLGVGGRNL